MAPAPKPSKDMRRDVLEAQLPTFHAQIAALTPRESEVAEDIMLGLTAEESGQRRGIAKKTIDVYRLAIYRVFGVRNAAQVARIMTLAGH